MFPGLLYFHWLMIFEQESKSKPRQPDVLDFHHFLWHLNILLLINVPINRI